MFIDPNFNDAQMTSLFSFGQQYLMDFMLNPERLIVKNLFIFMLYALIVFVLAVQC